jgi:hypothetical protein
MTNLMDKVTIKKDLITVAQTIKASDEGAAQRLIELSSAVGGGANADAWAVSDIYQMIGPDTIIERYKNQHVADTLQSWLEWIRNALIFAPLIVTWFGVSQAVDKYSAYIKANPDQTTQPFLLLWQNGFDHRLPAWQTLSWLASVDFIILTIVLVLTISVYSISNTVKAKRERQAEELRLQLLHSLSGATLQLQTRNWQQPTNILDRFNDFGKEFTDTITQLLNQIAALEKQQRSDFQTFVTFKNELAADMKAMSAAAIEMKNSTNELKLAMSPLSTSMQTLTTQQKSYLVSVNEAITLFKNQAVAQGKVVQTQEQWGKELSSALTTLKTVVEQDKTALTEFTSKQTRLIDEQTRLTGEQRKLIKETADEHVELAAFVREATNGLKLVVTQINQSSIELKAINIQMDDLVRRVAAAMPPTRGTGR